MFQNVPVRHSIDFEGKKITLETGLLAQQATASVLATCEGTSVLAVVTVGKTTQADYFPLQIIYEERYYAAGKMKDSLFNRREGRPNDNAILTGRMIDRSLRSLFDPSIRTEVQIVITVLSFDKVNQPDTLAVLAASSALSLCDFVPKSDDIDTKKIEEYGEPHPESEELDGICAIIFDPKLQKYAFTKNNDPDYLPVSGGRNSGESLEDTVRREVAEEVGISRIDQIYRLGEHTINHYYHTKKQSYKSAKGNPFLVIVDAAEIEEKNLESHENGLEIVWIDAKTALDNLSDNQEQKVRLEPLIEYIKRGVSKAIGLGLDVISDPLVFNKQFAQNENIHLFKGAVASVRIGHKSIKSLAELTFDSIVPTIENLSSLGELKTMEHQLTQLLSNFDKNDPQAARYTDQLTRLLAKKSPTMGLYFKEMLDKSEFTPNDTYSQQSGFLINPTYQQMTGSSLDLVISGNGDNIVMVECGADIVPEETIAEALKAGLEPMKKLVDFQREFVELCKLYEPSSL